MEKTEKAPLLKTDDPLFYHNVDSIIISLSLLAMGIFIGGISAFYQAAVCTVSSVIFDYAGNKLVLKKNPLGDLSAVSCGLVISLFLPACAPLWLGICACAFAVIVAKLPFGGSSNAPFVPAACGICFVSLCFPQLMFTYAASSDALKFTVSTAEGFKEGVSLLDMISSGTSIRLNLFGISSVLTGSIPGALGATSMLAMGGVLIYLFFRRPLRALISVSFISACAAFSLVFPQTTAGALTGTVLELSAGTLVLTALLVVNDPSAAPKKPLQGIIYGFSAGLICMFLRKFSKIEDPTCFSVMLINAVYPVFIFKSPLKRKASRQKISPSPSEESEAVSDEKA